jgi:hypothetical protein
MGLWALKIPEHSRILVESSEIVDDFVVVRDNGVVRVLSAGVQLSVKGETGLAQVVGQDLGSI